MFPRLIQIVEDLTFIQIVLVIILVLLAYVLKYAAALKHQRRLKISAKIADVFHALMKAEPSNNLKCLRPYRKYQAILIKIIHRYDEKPKSEHWTALRQAIVHQMILPNARRYARSRVWTWRYLACQSFELTLKTEDQKIIRELVQDPVLIISIHAALIALNYDSQSLVDQVIDVFANNRHIQQSLYAQLVTHPHPNFPKRVFERLNLEQDAYIKAFCYRLLTASTQGFKQSHQALLDAKAPLLELRIAALTYLATKEPDGAQDLLLSNLNDEHWEVRAISVKLLGTIGKPNNISALESGLNDPAWWVRLSTAEALLKLGPKGQAILDEQSNKKDKFSYDTAQSAIKKVRSADD